MRRTEQLLPLLTGQFAEFLLRIAVGLASSIEEEYSPNALMRFLWRRKFQHQDFQDLVTEFSIVLLHFVDRQIFLTTEPDRRKKFMDSLLLMLSDLGATKPMNRRHPIPAFRTQASSGFEIQGINRDLYNRRGAEYSLLKVIPAADEPLVTGTLSWELGKYVGRICEKYGMTSSKVQYLASVLVENAFGHMIPLVSKAIESAFQPTDSL